MGRVETCLDEVLALGLGNERLELGGGEGVDETGLGHDKEENLGAGEGGELVRLQATAKEANRARGEDGVNSRAVEEERTFFIMPAFRFEKVM